MPRPRIAFVVPTRNRASMAVRAARSILVQLPDSCAVLVSDNSSDPSERARLIDQMDRERVTVACTPSSLPMSAHWEWALQRALVELEPTHVGYVTDRMLLRQGSLHRLERVVRSSPEETIVFPQDRVDDVDPRRVRLNCHWATGGVYRIASLPLLQHTARVDPFLWTHPRMLNSLVPVQLLEHLSDRAGHVFSSYSPDCYFAFWALSLMESYLALDVPLMVHYGMDRSTGYAMVSGGLPKDTQEFADMRDGGTSLQTPYPDVLTLRNVMLHEYEVVRIASRSDLFPPLEADAVRSMIIRDLSEVTNDEFRSRLMSQLGITPDALTGHGGDHDGLNKTAVRNRPARQAASDFFRTAATKLNYSALPAPLRRPVAQWLSGGYFTSREDALAVALELIVWKPEGGPATWPPGAYEKA